MLRAGKRDLPRISRSGVRSGQADSPERQTSEFQLQRQRHRDCRPDAACIPLSAGAVAGEDCSAGGSVAMLLRSFRFGSGHDGRKGGGQALKLASRRCRGRELNVGEPFRKRCGASLRSCRTARTPWRGLGTPGTGTPVEQNEFFPDASPVGRRVQKSMKT